MFGFIGSFVGLKARRIAQAAARAIDEAVAGIPTPKTSRPKPPRFHVPADDRIMAAEFILKKGGGGDLLIDGRRIRGAILPPVTPVVAGVYRTVEFRTGAGFDDLVGAIFAMERPDGAVLLSVQSDPVIPARQIWSGMPVGGPNAPRPAGVLKVKADALRALGWAWATSAAKAAHTPVWISVLYDDGTNGSRASTYAKSPESGRASAVEREGGAA